MEGSNKKGVHGIHVPFRNMKEKQVDGWSFGGGMDIFKKNEIMKLW